LLSCPPLHAAASATERGDDPHRLVRRNRDDRLAIWSGDREIVVRSKPEDRKASGLRHFYLYTLEQRAV
jgi:hypothetical protein